jgi:hypothetical protein
MGVKMTFEPCISCGSYEIDPATGLCDECAEDMGIDDDYEDYEDDE